MIKFIVRTEKSDHGITFWRDSTETANPPDSKKHSWWNRLLHQPVIATVEEGPVKESPLIGFRGLLEKGDA